MTSGEIPRYYRETSMLVNESPHPIESDNLRLCDNLETEWGRM